MLQALRGAELASSAARGARHACPSATRRRRHSSRSSIIGIGITEQKSSDYLSFYTTSSISSSRSSRSSSSFTRQPNRWASRTPGRLTTQPLRLLASFSHRAAMCDADPTPSAGADASHDDTAAGASASSASSAPSSTAPTAAPEPTAAAPTPTPILSSNVDSPAAALQHLSTLLPPNGKWSLSAHSKGLERSFQFKTFKTTWQFMDAVAAECRDQRHHPEWANVYNRVHVRWTTHRPPGLSMRDIDMARFCDDAAAGLGEVVVVAPSSTPDGSAAGSTAPVVAADGAGGGDAVLELSNHIAKDACDVCAR